MTEWLTMIGLDPTVFGTHSLRRTKATLIAIMTAESLRSNLNPPPARGAQNMPVVAGTLCQTIIGGHSTGLDRYV